MRAHSLVSVSVVLGSLVACSASAPQEHVGQTSENIVGGQADTTHQAVVAIGLTKGECSGTIVKTDPATGVGWVLAAAHCIALGGNATVVIQGDDITSPSDIQYQVLSGVVHPSYNSANVSSDHDFSVITIAGVDATTPTMKLPTSTSDGVAVGNVVTSVGYGAIAGASGSTPATPSNIRKNVTMRISKIYGQNGGAGSTQIEDDIGSSGSPGATGVPCSGDSGGPVLDANGVVIAVHSYGDASCVQSITSDRVSSELTWINQQLATTPTKSACALCQAKAYSGKNTCAQRQTACNADPACKGINTCAQKCAANDNACVQNCFSAYPLGLGLINAIDNCGCDTACVSECKGDTSCSNTPSCGFSLPASACTTYSDSNCCAETLAASNDKVGFLCLQQSGKYTGCGTNPAYQALMACQAKSPACAATPSGGGADAGAGATGDDGGTTGSGSGTGGSTTVTHSGCSTSGGPSPSGTGLFLAAGALALGLARRRRAAR